MTKKRMKEMRKINAEARSNKLEKSRKDLNEMRAMLSAGGSIDNPAKIKEIKKNIARLLTVMNENNE